jgi:hypothetical protein
MKLHLLPTLCAAALLSTAAVAAGDKALTDMGTWDSDTDKHITMKEWDAAIDNNALFDKIDKNNNGNFDVDEAVDKVLDYDMKMDLDAGGTISRDEFKLGLFNMQDANDDDVLDEKEFMQFSSNSEASPLFKTN